MTFTIRQAAAGDFPAVVSLLNDAYAGVGIQLGETVGTVWKRSTHALVIVAEFRGIIVATVTLAPLTTAHRDSQGLGQMEVSRVAVSPLHQGQGFGVALMETVIDMSRRQGVSALRGVSLGTMTAAHRLYESAGAKQGLIPGTNARDYILDLTTEKEN